MSGTTFGILFVSVLVISWLFSYRFIFGDEEGHELNVIQEMGILLIVGVERMWGWVRESKEPETEELERSHKWWEVWKWGPEEEKNKES